MNIPKSEPKSPYNSDCSTDFQFEEDDSDTVEYLGVPPKKIPPVIELKDGDEWSERTLACAPDSSIRRRLFELKPTNQSGRGLNIAGFVISPWEDKRSLLLDVLLQHILPARAQFLLYFDPEFPLDMGSTFRGLHPSICKKVQGVGSNGAIFREFKRGELSGLALPVDDRKTLMELRDVQGFVTYVLNFHALSRRNLHHLQTYWERCMFNEALERKIWVFDFVLSDVREVYEQHYRFMGYIPKTIARPNFYAPPPEKIEMLHEGRPSDDSSAKSDTSYQSANHRSPSKPKLQVRMTSPDNSRNSLRHHTSSSRSVREKIRSRSRSPSRRAIRSRSRSPSRRAIRSRSRSPSRRAIKSRSRSPSSRGNPRRSRHESPPHRRRHSRSDRSSRHSRSSSRSSHHNRRLSNRRSSPRRQDSSRRRRRCSISPKPSTPTAKICGRLSSGLQFEMYDTFKNTGHERAHAHSHSSQTLTKSISGQGISIPGNPCFLQRVELGEPTTAKSNTHLEFYLVGVPRTNQRSLSPPDINRILRNAL